MVKWGKLLCSCLALLNGHICTLLSYAYLIFEPAILITYGGGIEVLIFLFRISSSIWLVAWLNSNSSMALRPVEFTKILMTQPCVRPSATSVGLGIVTLTLVILSDQMPRTVRFDKLILRVPLAVLARLLHCLPPIWRNAEDLCFSGSLLKFCTAVSSSCLHHGGSLQYSREGGRELVAVNRWMEDKTFCQSLRNAEMLQAVEDNARAWSWHEGKGQLGWISHETLQNS